MSPSSCSNTSNKQRRRSRHEINWKRDGDFWILNADGLLGASYSYASLIGSTAQQSCSFRLVNKIWYQSENSDEQGPLLVLLLNYRGRSDSQTASATSAAGISRCLASESRSVVELSVSASGPTDPNTSFSHDSGSPHARSLLASTRNDTSLPSALNQMKQCAKYFILLFSITDSKSVNVKFLGCPIFFSKNHLSCISLYGSLDKLKRDHKQNCGLRDCETSHWNQECATDKNAICKIQYYFKELLSSSDFCIQYRVAQT